MGYKKRKEKHRYGRLQSHCFHQPLKNHVLVIKTMSKPNTKSNQIKVRVTDKQRQFVSINAKKLHMNTSQYIRYCIQADYPGLVCRLPESIATSNLLNQIYHQLEGRTDPETLAGIRNAIRDYYNAEKGEKNNA